MSWGRGLLMLSQHRSASRCMRCAQHRTYSLLQYAVSRSRPVRSVAYVDRHITIARSILAQFRTQPTPWSWRADGGAPRVAHAVHELYEQHRGRAGVPLAGAEALAVLPSMGSPDGAAAATAAATATARRFSCAGCRADHLPGICLLTLQPLPVSAEYATPHQNTALKHQ